MKPRKPLISGNPMTPRIFHTYLMSLATFFLITTPRTTWSPTKSWQLMISQEEHFNIRPSIRIVMPDNLKSLIVDDWERVTKNGSVVALPAPKPVRQIFQDWRDEEEPKRRENRIDVDVFDEVISGMLEYFDVMLDKVLLYRYERAQYRVFRSKFQETENFGPVDVYGAEHLIRLFSKSST